MQRTRNGDDYRLINTPHGRLIVVMGHSGARGLVSDGESVYSPASLLQGFSRVEYDSA